MPQFATKCAAGLQAKALTVATGATLVAGSVAVLLFQLSDYEVKAAAEIASVRKTLQAAEHQRVCTSPSRL